MTADNGRVWVLMFAKRPFPPGLLLKLNLKEMAVPARPQESFYQLGMTSFLPDFFSPLKLFCYFGGAAAVVVSPVGDGSCPGL